MSDARIRRESSSDGAVQWLVLDGPPGNVIGSETCIHLRTELDAIAGLPEARLVALRGEGKHFSYGASVEEHLPDRAERMLGELHGVVRALVDFPLPTLAAVRGRCLGGGFEVALACGMLFVEEGSVFAAPEVQLGVFAPAATALLADSVPRAIAEEMLLTGRDVSAAEAVHWGLANRLVDAGTLEDEVESLADKSFRPRSAASLRIATGAVRETVSDVVAQRLDRLERRYLGDLLPLHDGSEGIRAFLEKRQPEWKHA